MDRTGKNQWLRAVNILFLLFFTLTIFFSCNKDSDPVELTFASWRTDDVDEMNRINALFTLEHPDITVRFQAHEATQYDDITREALENGEGADIILLRSYDKGLVLYQNGYLRDLTGIIPDLETFPEVPVKAWSTEDGVTYGVPSVGVTHGIYYNKTIFDKYNIGEPATWDEFIAACELLLAGGETVLAQGALDPWTLNFIVFSGLGANLYGGEAARQALLSGDKKLTDPEFVDAFKAVFSLRKYMPAGFESLGYEAARQLFAEGRAAMFIGGSWEISVFEGMGAGSQQTGWFAPPVKKAGDKLQYCFHVDAGIGLNKKSKHRNAATEYIKWVAGSAYAQAIMDELPGFFSYTPASHPVSNPLAREMFDAAASAILTVRLMSEKLNSGEPTGDSLLDEALRKMMTGIYTPEEAAAFVQEQLDTWFNPGGR